MAQDETGPQRGHRHDALVNRRKFVTGAAALAGTAAITAPAGPAGAAVAQAGGDRTTKTLPHHRPGDVPQLGVYRWASPDYTDAYADWLGDPTMWGATYTAGGTWSDIIDPSARTAQWGDWVRARGGRNLILGMQMLPGPADLSGPASGPGAGKPVSLAAGARGDYDSYFEQCARALVGEGLQNALLRPGWEFNGDWFTSRASTDPPNWVAFWRRIVTVMRSVPRANFGFIWNPSLGLSGGTDATTVYPGDDFVDYVGVDVYDGSHAPNTYPIPSGADPVQVAAIQEKVWQDVIYGGEQGLAFWEDFSTRHQKGLVLPEWGVMIKFDGSGGGDDPGFIANMYRYIVDNPNVVLAAYFDVNVVGDVEAQLSPGAGEASSPLLFPQSSAVFKELFAPRSGK